jgi:hypothetical protein
MADAGVAAWQAHSRSTPARMDRIRPPRRSSGTVPPRGNLLKDIDATTGKIYGPWRTMHVPLPEKLWLAPEAAERKGGQYLFNAS